MIVGRYTPLLRHIYDPSMQTFTYLLACPQTKQSILINPVWTSNCLYGIQKLLSKNDWFIKYSINTPLNCVESVDSLTSRRMEKIYLEHHCPISTNQTQTQSQSSQSQSQSSPNNRLLLPQIGDKIVCGSIALQAVNNAIYSKCGNYNHSFIAWTSLHKDFAFIQSQLMQPALVRLTNQNELTQSTESTNNININGYGQQQQQQQEEEDSAEFSISSEILENEETRMVNLFDGFLPNSCHVFPAYSKDENIRQSLIGTEIEAILEMKDKYRQVSKGFVPQVENIIYWMHGLYMASCLFMGFRTY